MKLPVIAMCTMLSAFALPATADTLQLRTAEFNGASGQAQTLLYNGESTDSQLVKRKHRHSNRNHHRHSSSRYRGHSHHHHNHGYYGRPHYRPYYNARPYYYNPYRYSYPRSGFYFRIF